MISPFLCIIYVSRREVHVYKIMHEVRTMCNQNFATETSTAQFRLWTHIFLILAHSSPFFYRYFDIFDTLSLKKIVEIFSFRLILFCKNRRDLYFFLKSSETWDKRRQRCWFLVGQLISKVKYINLKKKKIWPQYWAD